MPKEYQSMFGFPPRRLATAGLLALTLVGCSGEEEVVAGPTTRPVKTFIVEGSVTDSLRTFPGRVDANKRADGTEPRNVASVPEGSERATLLPTLRLS